MKKNIYLLFLLCSLIFSVNLYSQVDLNSIQKDLPKLLGANNSGTEFWFSIPPCYEDESGGHDNFVKIYVTSPVKSLVKIEVPGKTFSQTKWTFPNDIIEFNIPAQIAQPFSKGGHDPAPPDQVYKGSGIHITSESPIVVYVIIRYWYTSDGFLAFPVSKLGQEYIAASYPDMSAMYGGYYFPSEVTITGAFDDTKLNFTVGGNIMTKTASGAKPGETLKATLQTGDVWVISSSGAEADLSGSKILANKPVSIVSGNQCTNIPTNNRWCDYTVEADIPTYTWSNDYHVPKVPKRKYPSIIRIFAKEDSTIIYRDGNQIGLLSTGGGVFGKGYTEMRMSDITANPKSVVISGNKPIGVTLYNTGVEEDGYPFQNSDPFMMSITPISQYQKQITFCTPGVNGSGFPENYVNIIFESDANGSVPDSLLFGEFKYNNSIWELAWEKVKTKFNDICEKFSYNVDGKVYSVKTITLPKDGVYSIKSNSNIACYSFGYSYCDSYGYPTSAALLDEEKSSDRFAPVSDWSMSTDGVVDNGVFIEKPDNPLIRSNFASVYLIKELSSNFVFSSDKFIPGSASTINWKINVIDKKKDAIANIKISDRRGNDTIITVVYKTTFSDVEDENNFKENEDYFFDIFPNPTKNLASIKFYLKNSSNVQIILCDESGKVVEKSNDNVFMQGYNDFSFSNRNLPSGKYYCFLKTGDRILSKSIILEK